jgi:hypothetical protein
MTEELLVIICLIIGIICGAPLGYLLGRYRITIRKTELIETRLDGYQPKGNLNVSLDPPQGGSGVPGPQKQERPLPFRRKRMD